MPFIKKSFICKEKGGTVAKAKSVTKIKKDNSFILDI